MQGRDRQYGGEEVDRQIKLHCETDESGKQRTREASGTVAEQNLKGENDGK